MPWPSVERALDNLRDDMLREQFGHPVPEKPVVDVDAESLYLANERAHEDAALRRRSRAQNGRG